jgi:hypothetical protein
MRFRDIRPEATDVQTVHHRRELSGSPKIDYTDEPGSMASTR